MKSLQCYCNFLSRWETIGVMLSYELGAKCVINIPDEKAASILKRHEQWSIEDHDGMQYRLV